MLYLGSIGGLLVNSFWSLEEFTGLIDRTLTLATYEALLEPTNRDIVYVAVPGKLWAPSSERGLYKTSDGGRSWQLVLKGDDDTGVGARVGSPPLTAPRPRPYVTRLTRRPFVPGCSRRNRAAIAAAYL